MLTNAYVQAFRKTLAITSDKYRAVRSGYVKCHFHLKSWHSI